jgi:hypothetical protein
MFPHLVELRSEEADELLEAQDRVEASDGTPDDPAKVWLSEKEFSRLSTSEKYQLALERYRQSRKSKWEIGRDFERFIGFQYEAKGFSVAYQGIVEGLEDLGRDLICRNGRTTEIVQCKYWSTSKVIHEKHIFQLFGTVFEFAIDHPNEDVSGTFVTSTSLSDKARDFAARLKITVREHELLQPYPCIKCNVSLRGGERIYHLPFDQQYDSTNIDTSRLECYVGTVAEAEALGFRRAHRWLGKPD